MKIATFNVNGIRSRLPNLLAWLDREQPDIACLQELKAADAAFPAAAIAKAGYSSLVSGQRSWNGVSILARGMPIVEVHCQLPGDPAAGEPRLLGTAALASLGGRDPALAPERADVHVLGLFSPALGAQLRTAD